jgi:hypothetical protein
MNQADKLRQRNKLLRAKILQLTGISLEDQAEMCFEGAYSYLENVLHTDSYGMQHLPRTSEFWAWWECEWAKIDQLFIDSIRTDLLPTGACVVEHPVSGNHYYAEREEVRAKMFRVYHEANEENMVINSAVMNASAHKLIKELATKSK